MKKFFTLIAVAAMAFAGQAATLTVADGTAWSSQFPVYGWYYDATQAVDQMIYPADMLTNMKDTKITQVKFYTDEGETIGFYGGKVELSMMEVDEASYNTYTMVTGATVVASINPVAGGTELVFDLETPYEYKGGNLMIQTEVVETGEAVRTYFCGVDMDYNCSYLQYYWWFLSSDTDNFLPKATFTYEIGGDVPPVEPTEQTAAPTFNGFSTVGIHAYFVEIRPTEPSIIYYRYQMDGGEFTEWAEYTEVLSFTINGKYYIEAYAEAPGKLESPIADYDFVVSKFTAVDEMAADKAVASVRYFNMAGQEMKEAHGVTIVVTTYTDGTTSTAKVVK